ncbi:MAG TPA: hypothetical protein PLQ76_02535, partial [bacterium]|nr:hypothetical protein [bacterium]
MNESKKWIIFSIVLVFITGLLAGFLLGMFVGRGRPRPEICPAAGRIGPEARGMEHHGSPDRMRDVFVQSMKKDLSLSSDQEKKLRAIMDANEKEL